MGSLEGKQLLYVGTLLHCAALHVVSRPVHGQQLDTRCESGALLTAARCMAPQTCTRWGLPLHPDLTRLAMLGPERCIESLVYCLELPGHQLPPQRSSAAWLCCLTLTKSACCPSPFELHITPHQGSMGRLWTHAEGSPLTAHGCKRRHQAQPRAMEQ